MKSDRTAFKKSLWVQLTVTVKLELDQLLFKKEVSNIAKATLICSLLCCCPAQGIFATIRLI